MPRSSLTVRKPGSKNVSAMYVRAPRVARAQHVGGVVSGFGAQVNRHARQRRARARPEQERLDMTPQIGRGIGRRRTTNAVRVSTVLGDPRRAGRRGVDHVARDAVDGALAVRRDRQAEPAGGAAHVARARGRRRRATSRRAHDGRRAGGRRGGGARPEDGRPRRRPLPDRLGVGRPPTPTTRKRCSPTPATRRSSALKLGAAGGPWHGHLTEIETPENPNFRRGLSRP